MTSGPTRQFPLELPHRPSLDRADIVVTEANRMAVAAVDAWPDWPHPVLIVAGPEGSGKSHLAAAWSAACGAASFDGGLPEARPFTVVVDGLERFAAAEERLFELLNAARLGGGFVLATARVAPAQLGFRLPDLVSRLKAAALVEIAPPDDRLLGGVLSKLFADRQIAVDAKLVEYMVARMERSLAAARDLAERVDRETLASKERVTRSLIRRILDNERPVGHDAAAEEQASVSEGDEA